MRHRLNEFLASQMPKSAAREPAFAELALLDACMRRLNDLSSKGVHAAVTQVEARQGLVWFSCEALRALDQRADRRAAETQDEVAFPVTRHRPVIGFGRTLVRS